MSLPAAWIDRIFTKLTLTYGQAFLRQYDGVEMADVKANWAHELAGLAQKPEAIKHGLENLPERPPNIVQFRELCRVPQSPVLLTNNLPPVDPKMAAIVKDAFAKTARVEDREWARRLKAKEEGGARLTPYQRACWREALGEPRP